MRMWMIEPKTLCDNHLLGEHAERHKHRHSFVKGHRMDGRKGQIEPLAMKKRHDELAAEMLARGMHHNSPYAMPDLSYLSDEIRTMTVDPFESSISLWSRCEECYERARDFWEV